MGPAENDLPATARHAVVPFARSVKYWDSEGMTWAGADGKPHVETAAAPAFAYLSFAGAAKLFAGTPLDWAEGVFLATHPPVRKPETIVRWSL